MEGTRVNTVREEYCEEKILLREGVIKHLLEC